MVCNTIFEIDRATRRSCRPAGLEPHDLPAGPDRTGDPPATPVATSTGPATPAGRRQVPQCSGSPACRPCRLWLGRSRAGPGFWRSCALPPLARGSRASRCVRAIRRRC